MIRNRPLLTVGLMAGAGFAAVAAPLLAATAFLVTGGFGGNAEPQQRLGRDYVAVTVLETPQARAKLAIDPNAPDDMLEASDYARDPEMFTDELDGSAAEGEDDYAYGDDGRLYRETEQLYAEMQDQKADERDDTLDQ